MTPDASETVTVVIPCRDQGAFVAEAIASVRGQDVPVELVVVDDGSTDDTPAVLADFSGGARILRLENRGVSAARNAGLSASRGGFVVFLDADDRLLPGALRTGREVLRERPDCAWTAGRHRRIDAAGQPLPVDGDPADHGPDGPAVYERLLRGNFVHTAAVMYRRGPLQRCGGFEPHLAVCEDWQLYLRLSRQWPAELHGREVSEYRVHGAQTTAHRVADLLRTGLAVLGAQRGLLQTAGERRAWRRGRRFWRRFYGERLVDRVRDDLRAGRYRRAVGGACVAARHAPRYTLGRAGRLLARSVGGRRRES